MSDASDYKCVPGFSPVGPVIEFFLRNRVLVIIGVLAAVIWGISAAPFDWNIKRLPRSPVAVDAIPDIGENQQIVFTTWTGRSPQDVEDQISYPLTAALLGVPGVKTVRSFSMFGFSTVYVIFKDNVEFYWSRSRILEKLNSLPPGLLPEGVQPTLGPDATSLGQIFWYTLEGRDRNGNPTGGWDLDELRSIQDWTVRYALLSAEGVSEVASVGGFVREYQVDVDPDAMHAYGVSLEEVFAAVRMANVDVGARTIEVNRVEYVIRGVGFIKSIEDIENTVIKTTDNVPIYVKNVARVSRGPALRRGALDKEGTEAVGGVVVVRYGENPLAAINNVKKKIDEISPGLPKKTLEDGTVSQVTIVPFYDRTGLIHETLGTLNSALLLEILVTIIIVIIMVMNLRSSMLISGLLPLAVLMCFVAMKVFGVAANIVALSGIAIAIGTMVDMGIVITENILKHLDETDPGEDRFEVVLRATKEVGSAVVTAVSTTVVSFLPVFTMVAAEGKLFRPLALTKTFALVASVIVAVTVIPSVAHLVLARSRARPPALRSGLHLAAIVGGIAVIVLSSASHLSATGSAPGFVWWALGLVLIGIGTYHLVSDRLPDRVRRWIPKTGNILIALVVAIVLTRHWMPLGIGKGLGTNVIFVVILVGGFLAFIVLFYRFYAPVLRWCLDHKLAFLAIPTVLVLLGAMTWLGFNRFFGWLPLGMRTSWPASALVEAFPGLGKEFMPSLDEGSFLLMPTTMPHASIGEAMDILSKQDMAITQIPEIESAVGKLGRADTPLDPAPISMIETVINYHPEYIEDESGHPLAFRYDRSDSDFFRNEAGDPVPANDGEPYIVKGRFERDAQGMLIPDRGGKPFRLWRPPLDPDLNPGREAWPGIGSPDDIWEEIQEAAAIPGTTPAPKLQPIAARIVMLQSGMRAPMGVKIKGPDLETIEAVGLKIEGLLKEVPSVDPAMVIADRIVGKPYLEIEIDRRAIARYGIHLAKVQDAIEVAIGGRRVTTTVEGRERYAVRVRYMRELRDEIESIGGILISAPDGTQVPLKQLASIEYVRGPQMIKSEDTFLVGYVLFDSRPGYAEVDAVQEARDYLDYKVKTGELEIPAGVSYTFAGSFENQQRAQRTLSWVLPLALFIIFMILYLQFRSAARTWLVFSGILVAWAGGFLMIWLYGQGWFLNFSFAGVSMRSLFQVHPLNLSVAVWVGFLALFGIATDDGVIMTTYLDQRCSPHTFKSTHEIRQATLEAGLRRVRPCLMTTATTVVALMPVLTSTGRGSDVMVPMAIPSFGGMLLEIITMFVVPVLYAAMKEFQLNTGWSAGAIDTVASLGAPILLPAMVIHGEVTQRRNRKRAITEPSMRSR
jgi:Cu(I)/Ag(I) efflux system membrane protein CusA/SilA